MSTPTESHDGTLQFENQGSSAMLNYQEVNNHHGPAPQISVTESTPEAQRKCVSDQLQVPSESECSAEGKELVSNKEDKLVSVIYHGQRGCIEDQRCHLDPSRSAPSTPQNTQRNRIPNLGLETETFLNVLANSQNRRLDDQRVFLPSLPGLKTDHSNSSSNPESNYLCYMVSKVQGSRMDDQRCSLPHIITSDVISKNSLFKNGSERTRSASFCTNAAIYPSNRTSNKKSSNPAEQDGFFNMISRAQTRRMEDQRCELKRTPKSSRKQTTAETLPNDSEALFKQLATSQSHRIDDQRVSLPSLPGIQNGGKKMYAAESDANYLYYMVSKVQGSRMDEQRCSAPFIFQNMSPSFQRRDADKVLQRSSSLNRTKTSKQEISVPQQEQFLKMMTHAQRGRMEEQRCSLLSSTPATPTPNGSALNNMAIGGETDASFRSKSRRLDKQHADPPVPPRTSGTSIEKRNAVYKEDKPKTTPQITVTQSTPTTSKRVFTRPLSMTQPENIEHDSMTSFPKSASCGQEASPAQLTIKVSMSFSSLQGLMNSEQPSTFPELFLTLGAPGDNLVIPLSPVPGRRLSLSLNLIPKDDTDTEQNLSNHPWEPHSGPPSPTVRTPSHSASSPQDKSMPVAITQVAKGQTAPDRKGKPLKGTAKYKPTQDKGKKTKRK